MVQADESPGLGGVDPHKLLPEKMEVVAPGALKVFRPVSEPEYQRYGKLRNARLYRSFGYEMPSFYILDDPSEIKCGFIFTHGGQHPAHIADPRRRY